MQDNGYKIIRDEFPIIIFSQNMNTQVQYSGKTFIIDSSYPTLSAFKTQISTLTHVPTPLLKLYHHSKLLTQQLFSTSTFDSHIIKLRLGLVGGKGGFGAKMKNEGSKKNKGNNTKFSRDLSGRKLDYAVIKKDCIEFYKKKIEEDRFVEEERKRYEVLKGTIDQANKEGKIDRKHKEELEEKTGDIMEAVRVALAQKKEGKDKEKEKEKQEEKQKKQEEGGTVVQPKQNQKEDGEKEEKEIVSQEKPKGTEQPVAKIDEQIPKPSELKPKEEDSEQEDNMEPQKKRKLSQPQPPKPLPKITFSSAADKLKSLFRK